MLTFRRSVHHRAPLSAFHILSTVLFIAVLPLTRSIGPCILHFILYEDYVCRNSIYVHSYGHHCASSILSFVIMFPFIFLHMGIIIVLIVIPSIRVWVHGYRCPRDKKSEKQEGNEVQVKETAATMCSAGSRLPLRNPKSCWLRSVVG